MIEGRVWRYGDHVNTDVIIPGRYLDDYDLSSLAAHAMEDIDPGFSRGVRRGDVIVAGSNFGCGSSREQAPLVLKQIGVGAVVAAGFARIFFRNAVNVGLPVAICRDAVSLLEKGDVVSLDLRGGEVRRASPPLTIPFDPLPSFLLDILDDGGLVPYMRKRLRE